jgi:hypothetical protein
MAGPPCLVTWLKKWTSNGVRKGGRCQKVWRRTPQSLWEDDPLYRRSPAFKALWKIKYN